MSSWLAENSVLSEKVDWPVAGSISAVSFGRSLGMLPTQSLSLSPHPCFDLRARMIDEQAGL